ncbi:MAG: nodulation protein NfeD [Halobacteriovoraceae bacterium]|nr:nodulation protein NfeD [Halobacteriovoraceae bacterium]
MLSIRIKHLIMLLFFLPHLLITKVFADNNVQEFQINDILEIEFDSSINTATLEYLKSALNKASISKSDALLIKMNTPGGFVTITKDILTKFGESDIPVFVWITPEGSSASSAGALISSGAHLLYMSEGTNIGAATPVELSGDIKKGDLRNKAINDLVALIQSLAKTRGHDPKSYSEMISEGKSFDAKTAKEKNIINGIVSNYSELFEQINGSKYRLKGQDFLPIVKNPKITTFKMDFGHLLLNILGHPSTAYILFLIGAALIYLELQAPGGMIAGSIGAVFLILAGISFQVLPLNFGALGLIILSFILFILEAFITSYGLLTIAGIASMLFGSLFLYRTENSYIEVSRPLIYSSAGAIILFVLFIVLFWIKDAKSLQNRDDFSLIGKKCSIEGIEENENGSYLYSVKVGGEIWKASSTQKFQLNDKAEILGQDKEKLILNI